MQILKKDGWIQETFGAATKIEIEVRDPATKHTVTLQQIERWLSGIGRAVAHFYECYQHAAR